MDFPFLSRPGPDDLSQTQSRHYIYLNRPSWVVPTETGQKILINPHFKISNQVPKIYINPFVISNKQIHINPPVVQAPPSIHVNPKFIHKLNNGQQQQQQTPIVLTKTKLIRATTNPISRNSPKPKTRYKIDNRPDERSIASNTKSKRRMKSQEKPKVKRPKRDPGLSSKKLKISSILCPTYQKLIQGPSIHLNPKFVHKLDNRQQQSPIVLTKTKLIRAMTKSNSRNSPKSKTRYKIDNRLKEKSIANNIKSKQKMKLHERPNTKNVKQESRLSTKKLKICNIPCPTYRKYGLCKQMGKCHLKHDPHQIALCVKFLQGACTKSKCLLSHNVSLEKMPTCKYYLEGTCFRDSCPYLHVRLSPKAEICRDFLEGFCKKASKCSKRHQFQCPEYEKYGKCPKQRCQYPHGKVVRPYLLNSKHKFSKIKSKKNCNPFKAVRRYYSKSDSEIEGALENFPGDFKSRPKLGDLPSFIAFNS